MRQDLFEYQPQFKLMIVGNHKPALRGVDEAMRRRLHLLPFTVTVPPAERDPDLPEKLRAEWPAILRWMLDGCLEFQRKGLAPPASVQVEAVVDGRVWALLGRTVAPARTGPQHVHNPADHPPVVDAMRALAAAWQQSLDPLRIAEPVELAHPSLPVLRKLEPQNHAGENPHIGYSP